MTITSKLPLQILRDTREQSRKGWLFSTGFDPAPAVIPATLATGDYSLRGHGVFGVTVERKTLQDMVGCLGVDRPRFERELARMRGFDSACVIIEAPQSYIQRGKYRGRLLPHAAWQGILALSQEFRVPFFFFRTPAEAERACFDFLRHYANHFWAKWNAVAKAATHQKQEAST